MAEREGVAGVARATRTGWKVVDNMTVGALAAGARTRVPALVAQACQAGRTVRVEYAFGPAALVGVADVLGQAHARARAPALAAHRVRAAGRGLARTQRLGGRWKTRSHVRRREETRGKHSPNTERKDISDCFKLIHRV